MTWSAASASTTALGSRLFAKVAAAASAGAESRRTGSITTVPCTALPDLSRSAISKIASQEPMSDQRKSPVATAARSVFSITA